MTPLGAISLVHGLRQLWVSLIKFKVRDKFWCHKLSSGRKENVRLLNSQNNGFENCQKIECRLAKINKLQHLI